MYVHITTQRRRLSKTHQLEYKLLFSDIYIFPHRIDINIYWVSVYSVYSTLRGMFAHNIITIGCGFSFIVTILYIFAPSAFLFYSHINKRIIIFTGIDKCGPKQYVHLYRSFPFVRSLVSFVWYEWYSSTACLRFFECFRVAKMALSFQYQWYV